jgi:hypothetical protein
VSARTAKEGAKGPSAASVHTDKENAKGSSSASAHTAKESDKGSSAGKESAKGSSPANLASSGIYSEKSAKSGEDKWGDLPDEETSKEDAKGLNEDDWVTTDEDEDENEAEAEAAKARKRRSDSIVDVRSSSEHKEGVKGPGSASKAENMEDETQGSSSEPKEIAKGSEASPESNEAPQVLPAGRLQHEVYPPRASHPSRLPRFHAVAARGFPRLTSPSLQRLLGPHPHGPLLGLFLSNLLPSFPGKKRLKGRQE